MGALHAGHLELVRRAKAACARVVVSIFVNPTQFGPAEDFDRYPRDEVGDLKKLTPLGIDLVFAPPVEEMYPQGFATTVHVEGVSRGLCGDARPGHFDGVATIVSKLFQQVRPDAAFFGEKDYQQLLVIRRLARDLDLDVAVVGVPTVRERDGLALSSRNGALSPRERAVAPALYRALSEAAKAAAQGAPFEDVETEGRAALLAAGFERVDYFEIRHAETLVRFPGPGEPARVFGAAFLGGTRLIDNVPVPANEKPAP
jgi:pantoate--beta-alanine ligase